MASEAEEILAAFDEEIQTACIGSVSECFEGDPPFKAHGCLSQATSVGGLLYISSLNEQYKKKVSTAKAKATKAAKAAKVVEVETVAEEPKKKCCKKSASKAEAAPKRKCVRKKK